MTGGPSATVGPYRLENRLGAGGMGEVWRAWDQRLDRSVAVKLIRPESATDQTARERFRREARAAAALTHPSVVRIYDIVESGEGDAIVMELVEGESLSRRIARGPLSIGEAVRLGGQVAEGLAAAHRRGILHRDLKSENVIITPEGDAKILDFGLAKRMDGGAEVSLTRSDGVVGTFRAMSPEQARGMALDPRSDLFSFGVLLYEMLTGVSPFQGESAPDTLIRICTCRQRPVRELRPEVPEALSFLVDRLLEKDPESRPQRAAELMSRLLTEGASSPDRQATWVGSPATLDLTAAGGGISAERMRGTAEADESRSAGLRFRALIAAAALLLVAAGVVLSLRWRSSEAPLRVVVIEPRIVEGAGKERAEVMASGLRTELLRGLRSLEGISPLVPEGSEGPEGGPVQICKTLAANEAMVSRLVCGAESCRIVLDRIDGSDGTLLWTQSLTVPGDRAYLLAETLQGHLRNAYSRHPLRQDAPRLDVREEDYREYLLLFQSFDRGEQEEYSAEHVLERLAEIRAGSPRFLEAHVFEADVLRRRFRARRDPEDLARALDLLEEARRFSPSDPRPLLEMFEVALLGGSLDKAEEVIHQLELLQPGDPEVMARRARLLDRRGDSREAIALMRKAAGLLPTWKHLFWAANMEYRNGEIAAARSHLEELLRRTPDHYVGQSKLAEIELMAGSVQRAAHLYSALVRRSPQFDELTNLGLSLVLLKRYPDAEHRYRQALALAPESPWANLNLADVCLLQGKARQAEAFYRRVLAVIEKDSSAASDWQLSSVQAQALAHLDRRREAIESIQRTLRLAESNAQAAYEASLVYTLIGDHSSALFNAEKALEQGVEPRWFDFAWFAPLRANPEFHLR